MNASDSSGEPTTWVAGADGFRDGWFVVLLRPADGTVRRRRIPSMQAMTELPEAPVFIGIDMVIGLPDRAERGGRRCDRAARSLLGHPRSSSVFSPPAHAALGAETYDEARRLHTGTADDPPGITIQAFHLLPKMREVADAVPPAEQDRIREVHPELAFYEMNGESPVNESKHDEAGRTIRQQLLVRHGFPDVGDALREHAKGAVGVDDVLDAHAVCWSARRMLEGTARRVPEPLTDADVNSRGRRMEIWW
jgi:predicted RNase H-like nuclease